MVIIIIIIIIIPYNRNTAHVECKNKGDASNNRGNWNHFKILQKILEQHTGKARSQGTTDVIYVLLFEVELNYGSNV
jgi:hypothetical protein